MKITFTVQFDRDLSKEEIDDLVCALSGQIEEMNGVERSGWNVADAAGNAVGDGFTTWVISKDGRHG